MITDLTGISIRPRRENKLPSITQNEFCNKVRAKNNAKGITIL